MITKIKSTTKSQKTKSKKRAINDKKMQSDHSDHLKEDLKQEVIKLAGKSFF